MFDLHALITKAESQFANLRGEKIAIHAHGVLFGDIYGVVLDNPALLTDAGEMSVTAETIAVQLTVTDLIHKGRQMMPEEGWSIDRDCGRLTLQYRVISPGSPNQHFVWLGTTRQRIQIYATLMDREYNRDSQ